MKIGLVVGRFQPFHKGHLYLLKKALALTDKIVIAIGSSNVSDEYNPLSYEMRVKMLEKVIVEEGLGNKVLKIVPSPDDPSDEVWLGKLIKNAGKFDVVFGNNDWTNDILEKKGYKVVRVRFLNRKIYQGVVIRDLLRKGKKWKNRVPAYLEKFIEKKLK